MVEIVAVACRYKPPITEEHIVYPPMIFSMPKPHRHFHVLHAMAMMHETASIEAEQGFLTNEGQFMTRSEAKKLVESNGQSVLGSINKTHLFSEDLW